MALLSKRSSHPTLSYTDGLAASWTDSVQLVGRILLGLIFLLIGWSKFANTAFFVTYFTSLKMPTPEVWPWLAGTAELAIGITLIFGLATRYAALATFVFVVIATAIGHRYWEAPPAQQFAQYNHFLKNLAIMGGALYVFALGGGRFSIDNWLTKR
jgi:putative oxidoreductase